MPQHLPPRSPPLPSNFTMRVEVEMGGCKASVTTFIVEQFAYHDQECYLLMVSERLGTTVSFSECGGIEIVEICDMVKTIFLLTDFVADLGYASELGNYAECSGAPNKEEVLHYARVILDCANPNPDVRKRVLLIANWPPPVQVKLTTDGAEIRPIFCPSFGYYEGSVHLESLPVSGELMELHICLDGFSVLSWILFLYLVSKHTLQIILMIKAHGCPSFNCVECCCSCGLRKPPGPFHQRVIMVDVNCIRLFFFKLGGSKFWYHLISSDQPVQLYPSCSLFIYNSKPEWMVFADILSVTNQYLICVTAVVHEALCTVQSISFIKQLEMNILQRKVITGFGNKSLRRLCGKSGQNLHKIVSLLRKDCRGLTGKDPVQSCLSGDLSLFMMHTGELELLATAFCDLDNTLCSGIPMDASLLLLCLDCELIQEAVQQKCGGCRRLSECELWQQHAHIGIEELQVP